MTCGNGELNLRIRFNGSLNRKTYTLLVVFTLAPFCVDLLQGCEVVNQ